MSGSDEDVRAGSNKKAKSSRVLSDESDDEEVIRRPKKKSRCMKGSVIFDSGEIDIRK